MEIKKGYCYEISKGKDYSIIYSISVELDELIAKFYKDKVKII